MLILRRHFTLSSWVLDQSIGMFRLLRFMFCVCQCGVIDYVLLLLFIYLFHVCNFYTFGWRLRVSRTMAFHRLRPAGRFSCHMQWLPRSSNHSGNLQATSRVTIIFLPLGSHRFCFIFKSIKRDRNSTHKMIFFPFHRDHFSEEQKLT